MSLRRPDNTPDQDERQWFEVQARVKVLAPDEDDAIDAVVLALSSRNLGVYPVAEFDARPCDDPGPRTPGSAS